MVTGITSTFLFLLISMKYISRRLRSKKGDRFFAKIHIPTAIVFIIVIVVHFASVVTFWNSRPAYLYITGFLCALCGLSLLVSGCLIKKSGRKARYVHRLLPLLGCICIAAHIASGVTSVIEYQKQAKSIIIDSIDVSVIPDGVYTGECDITYVYAKVEVTVKSGAVVRIDILEHRNERGQPAECITQDIIEQQYIDVDAVSGATNSSSVIKKAVQNALDIG